MAGTLRRGFKAEAERRALDWRARLQLQPADPLDPRRVAVELGIVVTTITGLKPFGLSSGAAKHLMTKGSSDFSAVTVNANGSYLIVENEAHPDGRRANSIAHEVSHVLLGHVPHRFAEAYGARVWDATMEAEADWLGGVLLVPRPAAMAVVAAGLDIAEAAVGYGVSVPLMRQRLNMSGARAHLSRRMALAVPSPRRKSGR